MSSLNTLSAEALAYAKDLETYTTSELLNTFAETQRRLGAAGSIANAEKDLLEMAKVERLELESRLGK